MEAKEYVELLEQFCATDLNYQINDNTIRVFEDNTLFYDYDIDKHQILLNERNNQSELGLWADEKMSNVHFALLIKSSIERLYNENAFNNYDGFHSLDELRDVIETSFEESSYAIGKKEEGKLSIVEDPSGSFLIEFYLDGSRYLIEETGEKSFAFLRFYNELLYLENKHKQLKEYQSVFKTTFSEAEILSIIGYDKYRCTELKNEIVSSLEINDMMLKTALNGAKVPHSTSQPVIYKRGTDYHIATFTFLYTRDDINKGAVDRPTVWTMADLRTGEIIEEFQTKEVDFSNASYDKKYMIRSNNEYNTSNEYYEKAFSILDNVRKKIIYNDTFDKEAYANYMEMILANIPEEYKRFYKDLSVDYVNEEDGKNANGEGDETIMNETEQLQELLDAIQKLQKCFDDKIAQDEHKNSLFDNMHRELIKYQNGAIDKKVDAMAMDIIMLNDNVKKVIAQNTDVEVSEDTFKKLIRQLRGISEELEDILYRENIEPFSVVGDDVDVKKQKIIGTVETNDESLNNKVAERGAEGYEKEDRVLRRENVRIYKYVEETQEETPEEK